MKLLDSNILIYAAEPPYKALLAAYVKDRANSFSVISRIETLGFVGITSPQIHYFESIFLLLNALPVEQDVIEKAIKLKQFKKMKLGDALIAATALVYDIELITRNTEDFKNIPGLKVFNPLSGVV